jgi:hypothetical protein
MCATFSYQIILSICIIADILNMPTNLSACKLLVFGNEVLGLILMMNEKAERRGLCDETPHGLRTQPTLTEAGSKNNNTCTECRKQTI